MPMLEFDAASTLVPPPTSLVCSRPSKQPSTPPSLFHHIGIFRSCTVPRWNHNYKEQAHPSPCLPRLAARNSSRTFNYSSLYLRSNREYETMLQKVVAFIGLFSLRVYRFIFCYIKAEKVWMSVPNPPRPMIMSSCILNTRWKSLVTVSICLPNLRSQAIPTQSFPTIPTRVPPLYSSIDICFKNILKLYLPSHYSTIELVPEQA